MSRMRAFHDSMRLLMGGIGSEEREQLPLPYPTATYSGHTFWPLTLV